MYSENLKGKGRVGGRTLQAPTLPLSLLPDEVNRGGLRDKVNSLCPGGGRRERGGMGRVRAIERMKGMGPENHIKLTTCSTVHTADYRIQLQHNSFTENYQCTCFLCGPWT
jgi:hypothetical protein